jgi:hypothetical protein
MPYDAMSAAALFRERSGNWYTDANDGFHVLRANPGSLALTGLAHPFENAP